MMDLFQELMASASAGFHGAVAASAFVGGIVFIGLLAKLAALVVESFMDFWRG